MRWGLPPWTTRWRRSHASVRLQKSRRRGSRASARNSISRSRGAGARRTCRALDAGLWGTDLTTKVPPNLLETHPNATFSDRLARDLNASAALRFSLPVTDPGARHDVAG